MPAGLQRLFICLGIADIAVSLALQTVLLFNEIKNIAMSAVLQHVLTCFRITHVAAYDYAKSDKN